MTVFGWDTSHYDDKDGLDLATMLRARSEGIVLVTAKVGEGGTYDDPADAATLEHAHDAGITLLGGYYVVRTPARVGVSLAAQAAHYVRLLDQQLPWWRYFPGWFNQVDLELWPYDDVSAADGIELGERVEASTGRVTVMYASRGQYGDRLAGWHGPLWNANYPSSRRAGFKDLYPGDGYAGWARYSGREPDLCQYASSATIAGKTTCDANAFRGTLAELTALLTRGSTVTDTPVQIDMHQLLTTPAFPYAVPASPGHPAVVPKDSLGTTWLGTARDAEDARAQSVANSASLAELETAVATLQASVDAMRGTPVADRLDAMDARLAEVLALLQAPGGPPAAGLTEADVERAVHAQLGRLGITVQP